MKAAKTADLPVFAVFDGRRYIVCNKMTWSGGETWAEAVLVWISLLYTFWLEAPPQLDLFKLAYLSFVLKVDNKADCTNAGQLKMRDAFIRFCQS